MTTSGGIGGLPTAPAVDLDCPTCCGGAGASLLGFREAVQTGEESNAYIDSLEAGSGDTLILSFGTLQLEIPAQPTDMGVILVFDNPQVVYDRGLYTGPLAVYSQTIITTDNEDIPLLGSPRICHSNEDEIGITSLFGTEIEKITQTFALPASTPIVITATILHGLTDDGSNNMYPIVSSGPAILHAVGVPI